MDGQPSPARDRARAVAGYPFRDSDRDAIENGIRDTDAEAGPWFGYPLGRITVTVALEPGASEMASVTVDGTADSEQQAIALLGDIVRNWHLSTPRSDTGRDHSA